MINILANIFLMAGVIVLFVERDFFIKWFNEFMENFFN